MIDELDDSKQTGRFMLSPDKEIYGELTLSGQNTTLYLQDNDFFNIDPILEGGIKGVLHDFTKVSLIQCIAQERFGSASCGNESYRYARIFPHYVVYGDCHISPAENTINAIHFIVDDAATLFYDYSAFGQVIDSRPYINEIVKANDPNREIQTGPYPVILYYSGKQEIFSADTIIGRVSASHNPISNLGGPDGVYLKNSIPVTIKFNQAVNFDTAIANTEILLRFLEIMAGRPQNLKSVKLQVEVEGEQNDLLQLYWCMPPKRDASKEGRKPSDMLLDAVKNPEDFSRVLECWLEKDNERADARARFSNFFGLQQYYTIDRLIGSANMFEILPSTALPSDVVLSKDLAGAKKECRQIFKKLEKSLEKDSMLGALGRLGKSTLKHKIRHRGQIIVDSLDSTFPHLFTVIDQGVDCRNYYVHGKDSKFSYNDNFDMVQFFIETLEFVFAVSDLIEAGWDAEAWVKKGGSHPFGEYRISYCANLGKLQGLLINPS